MPTVSYFGKGAAATPAGSVSKVTVPWPAATPDGDIALLVVTTEEIFFPAKIDTPDGWTVVDYKSNFFFGTVAVFTRTTVAGLPSVDVPVSSAFGNALSQVEAQLYVFGNAVRASRRGPGITIRPGNAGFWVTSGTFSGATPAAIDTLPDYAVGYKISVPGEYVLAKSAASPGILSGIEIEARPGTAIPTILGPTAGQELSSLANIVFRWLHNDPTPQQQFELRVRAVGSPTWQYVKPDGTLTAVETTVTVGTQSISVAPGAFAAGTPYEWSLRTYNGDTWSDYSANRGFTLVAPPVVTVLTPVVNLHEDLSPTVSWSAVFTGARVQTAYRVVAKGGDGTVIFDSGVILGNVTSFTIPAQDDFTNGAAVTFTVTLTQTGGSEGSGSSTVTVSWTAPANPTVSLSATDGPGIRVTVGTVVDNVIDVQRTTDGATWTDVAVSLPVRITPSLTLHDVLAPYGVPATYRARASTTLDGMKLTTPWVVAAPITSTDRDFYLVDSANPLNYLGILLTSDTGRAFVRSGNTSYPLGEGAKATVDYGPIQGDSGTINVLAQSQEEDAAVYALVTLNRPLWLRWGPDYDDDVPNTLAAIDPGPLVHERRYQKAIPLRDWPLKWYEQ